MTRDNTAKRVQDIFRDIFNDPNLLINDSMTASDIREWDSLNHVNILSATQREFNIKFALNELESLNNVGSLIDLILKKTNY